jgi:hypothetical protein
MGVQDLFCMPYDDPIHCHVWNIVGTGFSDFSFGHRKSFPKKYERYELMMRCWSVCRFESLHITVQRFADIVGASCDKAYTLSCTTCK